MIQNSITIVNSSRTRWKFPLARPELSAVVSAMLAEASRKDSALEIALVDDPGMAELNREYLGCQGPTNCLSFPAEGGGGEGGDNEAEGPGNLGWLALSTDTLLREAFLYGQVPFEHGINLLAHGLGHLMGYDHGAPMDDLAGRMARAGMAALGRWNEAALAAGEAGRS